MKIPVNKFFWIATAISAVILAIHSFFVMSVHFPDLVVEEFIVQRFDLNAEANLPTWWATILLFVVALCGFFIYVLQQKERVATRWPKFWLFFGTLYLLLSLDEAAQIHEILDRTSAVKWVSVYAPLAFIVLFVFGFYFFVIRAKDRSLRRWIVAGLFLYILGGLVLEWVDHTYTLRYAWRQSEYVVEEGLELAGTILVLRGCLLEINTRLARIVSGTPQWIQSNPQVAQDQEKGWYEP